MMIALLIWSSLWSWSESTAPVVGQYKAKIQISKSWIQWTGTWAEIRQEVVCLQEVELRLYDVRGRGWLRATEEDLDYVCRTSYEGKPLIVNVTGRAELLRPKDFSGWIEGDRDLWRAQFSLKIPEAQTPEGAGRFQAIYGQEILSEDLSTSSVIFRVAPPDYLSLTCRGDVCEHRGLGVIFRAQVELKKNLSLN